MSFGGKMPLFCDETALFVQNSACKALQFVIQYYLEYGSRKKEWGDPLFSFMLGGKAMAKKNTAAIAEELAAPILEEMGLQLWDVVYEKEGSGWYLRYYVDKEGGIDINSCEAFSRAISDVLDEADPIDGSYTLEVSSPGIERALTRDWHFEALMGQQLLVRLIRPVEGVRDFIGTLTDYRDGTLTLLLDEKTEMNVERGETAFIRLYNDFSGGVSK